MDRWPDSDEEGLPNASTLKPVDDLLDDGEVSIRRSAARALAAIGPVAVGTLISALEDPGELRQAAAEALGEVPDQRAVEPLIHALGN